ncbi:hypothetical protein Hanom_Chr17g01561501 [Helianthus anomalus]
MSEENVTSKPSIEVDTELEMSEIQPEVIVQDKEVYENDNVLNQGSEFIIRRNSEGM